MTLYGTMIGAGADWLHLTIEARAAEEFVLSVGVREEGGEHVIRSGPWQTLEKAQEVALRVAAEVIEEPKISWRAADANPPAIAQLPWGTRSMFRLSPLSSRRPCPACGGAMHYVATAATFLTNRRLRVCRSCGHSDPKPVLVYSA